MHHRLKQERTVILGTKMSEDSSDAHRYNSTMSALCPTPPHLLVDAQDRPYFLWDLDLTISDFRERLIAPDPAVRAYFIARLMRQAKPDDVFSFVSLADIRRHWPGIVGHLGETRAFWTWLLDVWKDR